jgi:hypothetical protein
VNHLHLRILRLVADRNQRELNNHDAADHVARLGWQPEVRFLGDLAAGSFDPAAVSIREASANRPTVSH